MTWARLETLVAGGVRQWPARLDLVHNALDRALGVSEIRERFGLREDPVDTNVDVHVVVAEALQLSIE